KTMSRSFMLIMSSLGMATWPSLVLRRRSDQAGFGHERFEGGVRLVEQGLKLVTGHEERFEVVAIDVLIAPEIAGGQRLEAFHPIVERFLGHVGGHHDGTQLHMLDVVALF